MQHLYLILSSIKITTYIVLMLELCILELAVDANYTLSTFTYTTRPNNLLHNIMDARF